jgi:mRNA interferase HigB
MRIISEKRLREFSEGANGIDERSRREKAMGAWITVVKRAEWANFVDVRKTFNHVDVYKDCVIFDVGGNKYRIIAKIATGIKAVFIRAVLTHAEYDENRWKGDCK